MALMAFQEDLEEGDPRAKRYECMFILILQRRESLGTRLVCVYVHANLIYIIVVHNHVQGAEGMPGLDGEDGKNGTIGKKGQKVWVNSFQWPLVRH